MVDTWLSKLADTWPTKLVEVVVVGRVGDDELLEIVKTVARGPFSPTGVSTKLSRTTRNRLLLSVVLDMPRLSTARVLFRDPGLPVGSAKFAS